MKNLIVMVLALLVGGGVGIYTHHIYLLRAGRGMISARDGDDLVKLPVQITERQIRGTPYYEINLKRPFSDRYDTVHVYGLIDHDGDVSTRIAYLSLH